MRYSPRQYAAALLALLKGRPEAVEQRLQRQFLVLVGQKGDSRRLGLILKEVEKQDLREQGLKKVLVETPDPITPQIKKGIREVLGKDILIQEKINPELIAGIKILINDEILVDASAKTQLRKLFF